MTTLTLTVVTLAGAEYVLYKTKSGGWAFPSGSFQPGETPALAARRVVKEWTATDEPKLELMDFRVEGDEMRFFLRALLVDDPGGGEHQRFPRMGLPSELEGPYSARDVEDMQKTSLNYKLTRA